MSSYTDVDSSRYSLVHKIEKTNDMSDDDNSDDETHLTVKWINKTEYPSLVGYRCMQCKRDDCRQHTWAITLCMDNDECSSQVTLLKLLEILLTTYFVHY